MHLYETVLLSKGTVLYDSRCSLPKGIFKFSKVVPFYLTAAAIPCHIAQKVN